MVIKHVPNSSINFVCEDCDYYASRHSQYNRHLLTAKHILVIDGNQKSSKAIECEWGKQYKHLSGSVHYIRLDRAILHPGRLNNNCINNYKS